MNYWTRLSIEYANQRNYLDDLFAVYPTIPEGIREISETKWQLVTHFFEDQNNDNLIRSLLSFDLFPIKDSYVAYLKRDPSAIARNPATVSRLCGRLYEMGLNKIFERCTEPKETNRQIGPFFKRWLKRGTLGAETVNKHAFLSTNGNAILDGSDRELKDFARNHLNYGRDKGLDFVAKFKGQYVIGEAKFLTDFGGHQNAQFNDALSTLSARDVNATIIGILDGVLYIRGRHKMYKFLEEHEEEYNIVSSLVLREFLHQL